MHHRFLAGVLVIAGLALACSEEQQPVAPPNSSPSVAALGARPTSGRPVPDIGINQGAAALICPPTLLSTKNLAVNPSFENGILLQRFPPGPSSTPPSAATGWLMHTSNDSALITTARVYPSTAPGPASSVGSRMLHIVSGSNEGGVFQQIPGSPAKVMFSVWVNVKRGRVFLGLNGSTATPGAWTTKHDEWEQIRACSDGSVPTGLFEVLNEDVRGGEFWIDRAEIREIL